MSLNTTRSVLSLFGSLAFSLGAVACGGDTGGSGGGGGTTSTSSTTTTSGTTSGTTSSTGSTTSSTTTSGTGGAMPVEYDALVLGTLAASDLTMAKATHDAIAGGGEAQAKALGDIGHKAMLGTTLLGTTQNQFLGFDRWSTDKMDMLYDNPQFQAAFGMLFSAPPTLEKWRREATWLTWGDLGAGDAFPTYYYVVVRGTLKDPATAKATHDAVAGAGKSTVEAAGDVGHVAFTGRDDATKALFIDIWKDSAAIAAVYSDPSFQMAFAQLFSGAPTIGVYQSTDWHQW